MKQTIKLFILMVLMMPFVKCNNEAPQLKNAIKYHPGDPFERTMVANQFFEIDTEKDNVVEGDGGTLVVVPKGSFMNSDGETVQGMIQIELAEALSMDQMLLSNLTTTSNGKLLESGGMLYLNASLNGESLIINEKNPLYIQVPTNKRKPQMMVYQGQRDEYGNMDWKAPKKMGNFLIPVDINSLNFYPEGFEAEVTAGMPFRNYSVATPELIDSLYYSLSVSNGRELTRGLEITDENEEYYRNKEDEPFDYADSDTISSFSCSIDPAIIRVIKSEKYQNTLISTREFEERLQLIFRTCRNDIIEDYIQGLDKDLWVLDSMAAEKEENIELRKAFKAYSKQKLTNVKGAEKYSQLLKSYYSQHLAEVKAELRKAREEVVEILNAKNEAAQKVEEEYKQLLRQREKYRMETYGFELTEMGWINIDRGVTAKQWGYQGLEVQVQNVEKYDMLHSYVVYTSIKSLYRLNTKGGGLFYVGNDEQREMLMPKGKTAVIISIGYQGDNVFIAFEEFKTGIKSEISMSLKSSSEEEVKGIINSYANYDEENNIEKDLEYMVLFQKEKNRQRTLKLESDFIYRLCLACNPKF